MKNLVPVLVLSGSLLLASCASNDVDGEEGEESASEVEIAVDSLPAAVRDAVLAAVPGMVVEEAAREVEDGETFYEASGVVDGREVDVVCTPGGKVVAVEKRVDLAEVPAVVMESARTAVPGLEILKAEWIAKGGAVFYEIKGRAGGKVHEVKLTPEGTVVEIE